MLREPIRVLADDDMERIHGAALEILEGLDPEMAIPRYEASYGLATVGDLLDSAIPDYNEDLDALHLQPVRAQAMEAFGLTEEDVLGVPSLYEPMEKGWALALVPGMVNLQVFDEHLLIADPFFRGEDDGQDADPFIAAMEALLPEGVTPHFLDDWSSYHLLYGEVHCGTNVVRTPRTAPGWWEVE